MDGGTHLKEPGPMHDMRAFTFKVQQEKRSVGHHHNVMMSFNKLQTYFPLNENVARGPRHRHCDDPSTCRMSAAEAYHDDRRHQAKQS
jgi:hypothetical protein